MCLSIAANIAILIYLDLNTVLELISHLKLTTDVVNTFKQSFTEMAAVT